MMLVTIITLASESFNELKSGVNKANFLSESCNFTCIPAVSLYNIYLTNGVVFFGYRIWGLGNSYSGGKHIDK